MSEEKLKVRGERGGEERGEGGVQGRGKYILALAIMHHPSLSFWSTHAAPPSIIILRAGRHTHPRPPADGGMTGTPPLRVNSCYRVSLGCPCPGSGKNGTERLGGGILTGIWGARPLGTWRLRGVARRMWRCWLVFANISDSLSFWEYLVGLATCVVMAR